MYYYEVQWKHRHTIEIYKKSNQYLQGEVAEDKEK